MKTPIATIFSVLSDSLGFSLSFCSGTGCSLFLEVFILISREKIRFKNFALMTVLLRDPKIYYGSYKNNNEHSKKGIEQKSNIVPSILSCSDKASGRASCNIKHKMRSNHCHEHHNH